MTDGSDGGGGDRWRGAIDARVSENTRRLNEINGDLRTIRDLLALMRTDFASLRETTILTAADLKRETERTATEVAAIRQEELGDLKTGLESTRIKTRNMIVAVATPLFAALVAIGLAILQGG